MHAAPGDAGLSFARACVAGGKWRVALSTVKLLAPIYDPEKIVCVGMNYREHCTEQARLSRLDLH